jgi:PAS domain S-box-containing protein
VTQKQDETLAAVTAQAGLPASTEERRFAPGMGGHTEQQLRTLVEGVPHLIWRSSDQGLWTWASPQWRAYTGQSQQESNGRGWLDVVHVDDRKPTIAAWAAAVGNGELDVEFRVRRATDGGWVWHRTTSLPVRTQDGQIIEWLGSTTDIQLYKDLQERQAESLAAAERHTHELEAEVRRREELEVHLKYAACHDDLTELCNRAWFMDRFRQYLNAGSARPNCSLLFLSGDRVNPSTGDIRNPATLRSRTRQDDGSIGRFSARQGRAETDDEDAGRGGGDAAASRAGLGHASDRGRGWMQSRDGAAVSGGWRLVAVPGSDPAQPAGGTGCLAI